MINLVMTGADGTGRVWQDETQLLPLGMYDDPAGFAARIKAALPLVNNLRVLFNEHSFNADGSLHPQMEAFLSAAVAQGFDLTLCYGEGDAQNIGIGEGRWPGLSNAQAMAALSENFSDVEGAWQSLLDWMDRHPEVAAGVYGWELMNESAGYRHSIRANGPGDGLTETDFIRLFADHSIALSQLIQSRAEGRVLVGGWGYNGDFLTLAKTQIDGQSALDHLRAGVGEALVWSTHLYPGWMGTNLVSTPAGLIARLEEVLAPVAGDAVLVTEINADGQIDNPNQPQGHDDFFAASFDWFADRGIGLGWFPGLQTGGSHLLYLEGNGVETYRHQHSLAHALNAFSMGQPQAAFAGDDWISATLIDVRLRNEDHEIAAGEELYDAVRKAGFGFGHGGDDSLTGSEGSNDFLYGGKGADLLRGLGADDFLFGQWGDDRLEGAGGHDNLFGGKGRDQLSGGAGRDYLAGGAQDDTYLVTDAGDAVIEHVGEGRDRVETTLESLSLMSNVEDLAFVGRGDFAGRGTMQANRITGGAGRDSLSGLGGADRLIGGGGADRLSGGAGRDWLEGGAGDDRLSGGAGADRFVFAPGSGADLVLDFQDGRDKLVLQGFAGLDSAEDLLARALQRGADVVIALAAGDEISLRGLTLAALADDIVIL